MSKSHPFSGLLVVDFTHVLAGPACSYYLGLLGAEVIKVESPDKGDAIRHRGGTDAAAANAGMSTSYLTQGAGKRSVTLDLESDDGISRFHQLLTHADVLVENHVPRTMQRLQLDEKSLAVRHPHLIHCAMTGYGRGGPQENTAAYDVNIQAACGLMEATGTQESGPVRTGAPVLDYGTALAAGFAISAALYERASTGQGSFIDVSMLETGLSLMSSSVTDYLKKGTAPERRGNLANSRSPGAGSFPCKEGVMSLGVNEESHFISLAHALDRQDWLSDPRYVQRDDRKIYASELRQSWPRKQLKSGSRFCSLPEYRQQDCAACLTHWHRNRCEPVVIFKLPMMALMCRPCRFDLAGSMPTVRHQVHRHMGNTMTR